MKVGKALYNILGSSKEIQENFPYNTTDYAPSSTKLVTNGDFKATGNELITDGSFPLGTTAWNVLGTTSLSDNYATVVGMGTTYSSSANWALSQNITVVASKSYIVKFTARIITGTGKLYSGWSDQINPQPFQQNITSSFVEYTYYKPGSTYTATYNAIAFSGEVGSSFEIKDITVKELGEDWTIGNGWSIEENKAKSIQTTSSNYLEQTVGTLVNAKIYKITFDLDIISATTTTIGISNTGAFGQLGSSDRFYTTSGTKTIYAVYDNSYPSYIRFVGGIDTEYTITNISIKEMIVTKIFPEIAPTGINAPYIVYSVVSNQPSESKEDNGAIDTASVEVYSFQDTYNKAIDLGVDVRAALKRVNGTYNTIEIQSIDYTNEQMDVNEKRDLWASIQDYVIRVKN